MNVLKIFDLGDGQIRISLRQGSTDLECPHSIPFTDPITREDRKELRWYLEEYLRYPYGAEEYRAQKVEKKMKEWGESLFTRVLARCDFYHNPYEIYQEAVRDGPENCELCIISENSDFLNIPWELLRDPTPGVGYLAPLLGGFYRKHTGHKIKSLTEFTGGPFRILLVVCRPGGKQDLPLGTVARPILEALRPLRPWIHLDVLRPPTFDALVKRLNAHRGYYHLVHFDGHGTSGSLRQGGGEEGYLMFEKEDGTKDIISSEDLGQALANCKVSLFVLNACQSAKEGKYDPYSSVASQLVAVGAKGVIAMSYSVYAVAACKFMQQFYETLVKHKSLSEAVAAGRRKLYADPYRETAIGSLKLRDWMVPTLYQQEYEFIPIPETRIAPLEEDSISLVLQKAKEVCPEGRFGFIGRDYDILRIERALKNDDTPWVLITGLGGIGKTELAYGFARWYAETGSCPGGVFVTSFKEKADFDQVIGSIWVFGAEFSVLSEEEQYNDLVSYLQENPCLLIWDNFETVAGYSQGAVPPATDEEQKKLSRFLKALRGSKSRVIITTGKPDEDWLGISYELIEIAGLTKWDTGELAKSILKTVGRLPEEFRADPEYTRLLDLLKGHPRSMEVVLSHLRIKSPAEIIEALQHRIGSLGDVLDTSLGYVFTQLSEKTQKCLPFIGLFTSYVNETFLDHLFSDEQVYREAMDETLDVAGWKTVLEEAASVGLIRQIWNGEYELHPTLSPFLRQQLISMVGEDGLRRLDEEFMKYYGHIADFSYEMVTKGDPICHVFKKVDEANLLRALRLAEMNEQWRIIHVIIRTLKEFYESSGRFNEWNALRRRLFDIIDKKISLHADSDQANLWRYLIGEETIHALQYRKLDIAEDAYKKVLKFLDSLHDPNVIPEMASCWYQLGRVAEEREHYEDAEKWYLKALEIFEHLGLEQKVAESHHQLGVIAQKQGQSDEARKYYEKALETFEYLGLKPLVACEYHNLGTIAQERHLLEDAEKWYLKALVVYQNLRLEQQIAEQYHSLGTIAQERHLLDDAEKWYLKAVEMRVQIGLEQEVADDYHRLGMIAEERRRFDDAEKWYLEALEILERLGLEQDAADECHALGVYAQKQNQFDGAKKWYEKALKIFKRLGLEQDTAVEYYHLGMAAQLLHQFDEAEQWYGNALKIYEQLGNLPLLVKPLAGFGVLRFQQHKYNESVSILGEALVINERYQMEFTEQILANLALVMGAMGEEEFTHAWQRVFNQEPPLEILHKIMTNIEK